jgi:hypothetical protein
MNGLDIGQLAQIVLLTPDSKSDRGARVGSPCMRIAYLRGEKFDETPRGIGVGREQLGQHPPGGNSDNILAHAPFPTGL